MLENIFGHLSFSTFASQGSGEGRSHKTNVTISKDVAPVNVPLVKNYNIVVDPAPPSSKQ